jgi:hypothetical protein
MPTPLTALESPQLWAAPVAGQADLPDERLNTRFGLILQALAEKPLDSLPQACGNASQAQALYRFLRNRRLDISHFLQPIADTTVDACRGCGTILAIQDSSSANYATLTHTRGLGKLNVSDALGIHFHTTIAVQRDGVVRGMLHQTHWCRPPRHADGSRPTSEKAHRRQGKRQVARRHRSGRGGPGQPAGRRAAAPPAYLRSRRRHPRSAGTHQRFAPWRRHPRRPENACGGR